MATRARRRALDAEVPPELGGDDSGREGSDSGAEGGSGEDADSDGDSGNGDEDDCWAEADASRADATGRVC